MTLPAFKRTPTCPKCGNHNIAFDYTDAASADNGADAKASRSTCGWTAAVHQGEHIHLSCVRCSYGKDEPWLMAVAQSARTIGFRLPDGWLPVDSTDALPE